MDRSVAAAAVMRDAVDTALGRAHRRDPTAGPSGGPAGNARLTAWLGLVLLPLFVVELVTLIDVHGLITWHLAVGALLIPPSVAKTATTGWRIVRYYRGSGVYVEAGPPPLLMRALGPLVVLTTLAVLATGVVVGVLGQSRGRSELLGVAGFAISPLTVHQASFLAWAAVTGLHVVLRFVPAVTLVQPGARTVPGRRARLAVLTLAVVLAALVAPLVVRVSADWRTGDRLHHQFPDARPQPAAG